MKQEVNTMDLRPKTIEQLFQKQMMAVTRESLKKLRSFDAQFSTGN